MTFPKIVIRKMGSKKWESPEGVTLDEFMMSDYGKLIDSVTPTKPKLLARTNCFRFYDSANQNRSVQPYRGTIYKPNSPPQMKKWVVVSAWLHKDSQFIAVYVRKRSK